LSLLQNILRTVTLFSNNLAAGYTFSNLRTACVEIPGNIFNSIRFLLNVEHKIAANPYLEERVPSSRKKKLLKF
jgi:hypothetical protein